MSDDRYRGTRLDIDGAPPRKQLRPLRAAGQLLLLLGAAVGIVLLGFLSWWQSDAQVNRRALDAEYYCLDHEPLATCLEGKYGWEPSEAHQAALAYLVYQRTGNGWPYLPRPQD